MSCGMLSPAQGVLRKLLIDLAGARCHASGCADRPGVWASEVLCRLLCSACVRFGHAGLGCMVTCGVRWCDQAWQGGMLPSGVPAPESCGTLLPHETIPGVMGHAVDCAACAGDHEGHLMCTCGSLASMELQAPQMGMP